MGRASRRKREKRAEIGATLDELRDSVESGRGVAVNDLDEAEADAARRFKKIPRKKRAA